MHFVKTQLGQQAFKSRSPVLSARQRSAFILFDGKKTNEQVMWASGSLGFTAADIAYMVEHGFIESAQEPESDVQQAPVSARTEQQRYLAGKSIATQLTASLGLRGLMLNLAVESSAGLEDLIALLPKVREMVGPQACQPLEMALAA